MTTPPDIAPDAPGPDDAPSPLPLALSLLDDERADEAETLLLKAARAARDRAGADAPAYAAALADLARFYVAAGQTPLAVDALRMATAGPRPEDRVALAARLGHELDLAETLLDADTHDEAESVLRGARDAAREAFGPESVHHADTLEPLARLLLHTGRAADALPLAEEAALIRLTTGGDAASALALRGWAAKATGRRGNAFAGGAARLSEDGLVALAAHTAEDTDAMEARLRRAVVADLVAAIEPRLGPDHDAVVGLLSLLANAERESGPDANHALRQEAIRRVLAARERRDEPREAIEALLGLALAHSDADEAQQASDVYEEAATRAEKRFDLPLLAQTLRNWGAHLAAVGEAEAAEDRLRAALLIAERTGNAELERDAARTLGGFLRQIGGHDEEAARLLGEPGGDPT